MKVLLDSSGWSEFFTDGPRANRYAAYLTSRHQIITPTIVLYEVYKKIKRERGEEMAVQFAGHLNATHVVPLSLADFLSILPNYSHHLSGIQVRS
ncbi:MAG: PIN domain-containing protein [Nitrospira sp.]